MPRPTILPDTDHWRPYDDVNRPGSTFFVSAAGSIGDRAGGIARGTANSTRHILRIRPPLLLAPMKQGSTSFDSLHDESLPSAPRRVSPLLGPRPQPPDRYFTAPPIIEPVLASPLPFIPFAKSSSILVHAGFWNILSAINNGSRLYSSASTTRSPGSKGGEDEIDVFKDGHLGLAGQQQQLSNNTRAFAGTRYSHHPTGIQKKQISVDMIGKPQQFAHLCHASDAEQGEAILSRWYIDGIGKLAEPAWVEPIKQASRARARARSIAQIQFNREEAEEQAKGSLKVINGSVLSSSSTIQAVENESIRTVTIPTIDMNATVVWRNDDGPLSIDLDGPILRAPPPGESTETTRITPTLVTIERAVATKVYFETYYHGVFKKPSPREQRKLLLEEELGRLNISDAERRNVRQAFVASESEHLRSTRTRVHIGSFKKLKTIGHGAFGVVSVCSETSTGELFAMKQLRKADMLRKLQEGHVRAERDLLESASGSTKWIVRLAYSFQDVDHLYLVMEYMAGGDLLNLLIERDTFPEDFARFYIAEMILAIEETHKTLGAIHRDIKPDNFLFSSSGHLKISDFGLATDFQFFHDGKYFDQQRKDLLRKHGIDLEDTSMAPATDRFDRHRHRSIKMDEEDEAPGSVLTWRDQNRKKLAYSVVGTNNYMSVEVLRGQGYDQSCDWWSCGIIAYEMLFGYPPFVSKSRNVTRQKIMNWRTNLKFPSRPLISKEAHSFIESLICEKENRLGSRGDALSSAITNPNGTRTLDNGGANEIKSHPWFRGIDWSTIHLQTPPFIPELSSAGDTKYFEDDIHPNPLAAPDNGVVDGGTKDPMLKGEFGADNLDIRKQLAFQGWTYKRPKNQVYDPRHGISTSFSTQASDGKPYIDSRGRALLRAPSTSTFSRSLSV